MPFLILTLKTVVRDEPIVKPLFRCDNHRPITWDKRSVGESAKAGVTLRLSLRISPITGLPAFVWLSSQS